MRGAIIGASLFEGWAKTSDEAAEPPPPANSSSIPATTTPPWPDVGYNHATMAVQVVRNETFGNQTYSTLFMGVGKVLHHGAFDSSVLDRLAWMNGELAPLLKAAIQRAGGIDIKNIIAQAVQMGDEAHNRNMAGNALFLTALFPTWPRWEGGHC